MHGQKAGGALARLDYWQKSCILAVIPILMTKCAISTDFSMLSCVLNLAVDYPVKEFINVYSVSTFRWCLQLFPAHR